MQMIDTHAHLYHQQFEQDRMEMLNRAIHSGVTRWLLPNIDLNSITGMMQLVEEFPERAFPMMGLHPCSVGDDRVHQLGEMKKILFENPTQFCAVGEIGIDLYWDKTTLGIQIEAFHEQIDWALELEKPIVIHVRDSFDETFKVLDERRHPKLHGVIHCFTGNLEQAQYALDLGFHLGIGGVATFKNGGLDQVLPHIDINRIVLETDSPFLAPVPYRGKRNEAAYTALVAVRVAELTGRNVAEIADITTRNAEELFQLK